MAPGALIEFPNNPERNFYFESEPVRFYEQFLETWVDRRFFTDFPLNQVSQSVLGRHLSSHLLPIRAQTKSFHRVYRCDHRNQLNTDPTSGQLFFTRYSNNVKTGYKTSSDESVLFLSPQFDGESTEHSYGPIKTSMDLDDLLRQIFGDQRDELNVFVLGSRLYKNELCRTFLFTTATSSDLPLAQNLIFNDNRWVLHNVEGVPYRHPHSWFHPIHQVHIKTDIAILLPWTPEAPRCSIPIQSCKFRRIEHGRQLNPFRPYCIPERKTKYSVQCNVDPPEDLDKIAELKQFRDDLI